jgi:hypothetical protein
MSNTQLFQSKGELVDFISEYLINHDDTIAIIRKDLKKEIVRSLLNKEDFDRLSDTSKNNGNVLFLIKTRNEHGKNLNIKICDAYSENTKKFKMVDINNILVIDGLISQDEMNSIIYYKEITKMQLKEIA